MVNSPREFEEAEGTRPLSPLSGLAMTRAPETGRPWSSSTCPLMTREFCCAVCAEAADKSRETSKQVCNSFFITPLTLRFRRRANGIESMYENCASRPPLQRIGRQFRLPRNPLCAFSTTEYHLKPSTSPAMLEGTEPLKHFIPGVEISLILDNVL